MVVRGVCARREVAQRARSACGAGVLALGVTGRGQIGQVGTVALGLWQSEVFAIARTYARPFQLSSGMWCLLTLLFTTYYDPTGMVPRAPVR